MNTATTEFGEVPVDVLVKHYELERRREARKYAKRLEFLQTDEGKTLNRLHSKEYYERNKAAILARRKAKYQEKKLNSANSSNSPVSEESPDS